MPPLKTIYLTIILILIIPYPTTGDQSYISILITQKGLNFSKDLLISKAISSLTPTPISEIVKNVKIPLIGKVHVVLKDISIKGVEVGSSDVVPSVGGVVIVGNGVSCDLEVKWHYSYGTWVGPVSVSDSGTASIKVNGMEISVTLDMVNKEGSMKLSVVECNCHINDISIDLDGGASWLYQGIVDAFEDGIVSAVEKAITKKLKAGISHLESILQTLPKQIPVDDTASLNATFVNNPYMSDTSLGFEINGLFIENKIHAHSYHNGLQPPVSCSESSKMIGIALDEAVFKSASALYYNVTPRILIPDLL